LPLVTKLHLHPPRGDCLDDGLGIVGELFGSNAEFRRYLRQWRTYVGESRGKHDGFKAMATKLADPSSYAFLSLNEAVVGEVLVVVKAEPRDFGASMR
jgi:hypothetical protein